MAAKMIILALCVASAFGSAIPHAAQYPAGVDPHTCPNYPNCDNVALAAHAAGHGVGHYGAPAHGAYGHHGAPGVPGAAHVYPAGVDPHVCPNYPYCGPTPAHVPAAGHHGGAWAAPAAHHAPWAAPAAHGAWAAPAAHGAWDGAAAHGAWAAAGHGAHGGHGAPAAAKYPAGVNPHSCPNYPYCN